MISAIKIISTNSLIDRIFKRKMKMSVGKLCGFDCLYILSSSKEIDYDKLRRLAGRSCRNLIVPKSLNVPEDIGINNEEVRRKILISSALEAVKAAKVSSLALIDTDGRYSALVPSLIANAGKVLIVTSRIDEYNKYCAKFIKKYGHIPIITDSTDLIDLCSVVIAPDGFGHVQSMPIDTVTFSPDSFMSFTVDESCIDFPFDTAGSGEYSPLDVFAALVVMSTKFQKTLPKCHSFIKNNRLYPFSDVVSMITALDIRVSSNYNINIANLFLNKRNGAV